MLDSDGFPDDGELPGFDVVYLHGRGPAPGLERLWRRAAARELEFPRDGFEGPPAANGAARGSDGA